MLTRLILSFRTNLQIFLIIYLIKVFLNENEMKVATCWRNKGKLEIYKLSSYLINHLICSFHQLIQRWPL